MVMALLKPEVVFPGKVRRKYETEARLGDLVAAVGFEPTPPKRLVGSGAEDN